MLLTADKIHNGYEWLPEGTAIATNKEGIITAIHEQYSGSDAVHHEGVLAPGFVNVHCHLELSHMKGAIPEHTGLIPFLQGVMANRFKFTDEQKKAAMQESYQELLRNGVVATGDIVNTTDTLELRLQDKMHIYSFVETIGFTETHAPARMEDSVAVYNAFAAQQSNKHRLQQAIVPHAPYSISPSLFRLIDQHKPGSTICIHNQETEAENQYYHSKEGKVNDLLQGFGIDDSFFEAQGQGSLPSYLPYFTSAHRYIFVHNTFSTAADVQFAHRHAEDVYWCLCPNANLYIENRLPDIDMFVQTDARICIGTDSLSSNHQLCILSELYSIKQRYAHLPWEQLLRWGTANGASALQTDKHCGSLETGKQPGIVQIKGLDTAERPVVQRII